MNRYINKSTLIHATIITSVFSIGGFIMVLNGGFCEGDVICLEKLHNQGSLLILGLTLLLFTCAIFIERVFGYEEIEHSLKDGSES